MNCKLWTVNSLPERHIVTSQVEHSSVLNYCMALERQEAPLLIQEGRPSTDGRGGYRQTRFSTTPAQGASPSSSEEGSRVSARTVTKTPLLDQEGWRTGRRGSRSGEHGYRVTYLPVDREGLLNLADLEAAITDETAVVSLMSANNETGVLFPVESIAEICRSRGVLYHCDAVQAAGKVEIDVRKIPADYLSLTGHKFHAPKGIGARNLSR